MENERTAQWVIALVLAIVVVSRGEEKEFSFKEILKDPSKLETMPNSINTNTSILIALPCYKASVHVGFLSSMLNFVNHLYKYRIVYEIKLIGSDTSVPRARTMLANYFLTKTTHTHLLFIDVDVELSIHDYFRMLLFDEPVVTTAYPQKSYDMKFTKQAAEKFKGFYHREPIGTEEIGPYLVGYNYNFLFEESKTSHTGFAPVLDAGTGVMLIAREAFETLARELEDEILFYNHYDFYRGLFGFQETDKLYAFFDTMIDPVTKRYLSEDYAFCRRWQSVGGSIWLNLIGHTVHNGQQIVSGKLADKLDFFDLTSTDQSRRLSRASKIEILT